MHIGFVAHNFVRGNGQGRINYETARHAARHGHHVTLLADRVDADLATEPNIKWDPIHVLPRRPNLIFGWRSAATVDRRLRRGRGKLARRDFDVVVGAGFTLTEPHDVNLCQFVHGAWLRSPVHVARLAHGPWAWYQWTYTKCNVKWEQQVYSATKIVVAPSEKIKSELISIGVPPARIAVIYNGVDPDEFYPRATPDADPAERAALGLPASVVLALFVGDIRTPRKNLDSVLKALVEVPQMHLAVVGAVEQSPFPALARELGVADRVTFTGFRSDVGRFMRAADLFVFPSRYEAGTLVLTEAAASGLPLVTAATAGGAEVFGTEAAQTIDDPDDLAALVRAIRLFANSSDRRRSAGQAALAATRRLTWSDMAAQYLSLFEDAANARTKSSFSNPPANLVEAEPA